MCETCGTGAIALPLSRRRLLTLGAGIALTGCARLPAAAAPVDELETVEVVPGLSIHPRHTWGADLPATRAIDPEEVRFLLVHHTASSNRDDDPRPIMRATYAFHTGPEKRWPDVCYHFFVARDGSVWEGRTGSLDGAVVADATGGNQGWAQLVCLLGDHSTTPPTEAAQASLVGVLAWLRWRNRLPRGATATTTFVSRGSNRHPAGVEITTPIVAGHRDHTYTACPGDAAYALLPAWRAAVEAVPDPVFEHDGPHPPARRLGVAEHG